MRRFLLIFLVLIVAAGVFLLQPGGWLIINNVQKSDALVVLAGGQGDTRYGRAMQLLRSGYAQHLVLDATTGMIFGHSYSDLAAAFVAETAGQNAGQVSICAIDGDSTDFETKRVDECLQALRPVPHRVILVTDDYHTRRALSIFRKRLPQYQWTAAAASNDFLFGLPWWKNREWAKTYLTELQKTLWWQLFDRWRK
jgi:hypothetical protein